MWSYINTFISSISSISAMSLCEGAKTTLFCSIFSLPSVGLTSFLLTWVKKRMRFTREERPMSSLCLSFGFPAFFGGSSSIPPFCSRWRDELDHPLRFICPLLFQHQGLSIPLYPDLDFLSLLWVLSRSLEVRRQPRVSNSLALDWVFYVFSVNEQTLVHLSHLSLVGRHPKEKRKKLLLYCRWKSKFMDVISDLPQAIIEIILTKLPIRDAVTTSVLSTEWRYKWTRITRLVFNDNCVPSSYEHDREKFLLNFIKSFLLRLDNDDGPIREFSLSTSFVRNSPLLKECLLLLSKKKEGIKKLVFELGEGAQGESFMIPYCLFTFSNLTHLELARCAMFLPPNFKGFLNLKRLTLQQIEAGQSSDGLAGLISSCPRLESLTLLHSGTLMLSIEAPNLKHLILEGEVMFIVLRHMPRLVAASFAITLVDSGKVFDILLGYVTCKFDKILGDLPCIERLVGRMDFTKHLSDGIDNIRYPIMYNHLKMVELSQVNFEDPTEFVAVIRLILCSPNLAELRLSGSNATTVKAVSNLGFMEQPCLIGCRFDRLRKVTIAEVCGTPDQMGFIKLILERSPALQVMTLVASAYLTKGTSSVLEHLNVFRRASAEVDVIFVQDGNSKFL